MEFSPEIKKILLPVLKAKRDEIDQVIKEIEGTETATLAGNTSGKGKVVKSKQPPAGKKHGRPTEATVHEDDDQNFGKCTIHAVANILREGRDGEHELSAADIMSELKRRWKIEASYKTVCNVLGRGKNKGRFREVGDKWRVIG